MWARDLYARGFRQVDIARVMRRAKSTVYWMLRPRWATKGSMIRVILESPYAGDIEGNTTYARRALRDSLLRGEAPIASHLLYTQPGVLDDAHPLERQMGIDAGLAWGLVAQKTVVYADRGISRGMRYGIERAEKEGRPVEVRYLDAAKG